MTNSSFSIDVTFGQGTENFSPEIKQAINDAADFWESVIVGNNSGTSHNIQIEVGGEDLGGVNEQGSAALAGAAPIETMTNENGNVLSTAGAAFVNTNAEVFQAVTSDIEDFTNTMKHEFGHVVGIGTLWEANNLIDPNNAVYNSNTNAGKVFGELQGLEVGKAIPLTSGVGEGSDIAHWQEEFFQNELMSHEAEASGYSMPLSELSIASLEDIGWEVNYGAAEVFPDESTVASAPALIADLSSSNIVSDNYSSLALEPTTSLM
ncbi:MAG: leishmanolysin-related zinc metalloendopeptidase [Waterburya sp.]